MSQRTSQLLAARWLLVTTATLALLSIVGCDAGEDPAGPDTASDATTQDLTDDVGAPDAAPDSDEPDGAGTPDVFDTTEDTGTSDIVADTSTPDTSTPDTSTPDTSTPDTVEDTTPPQDTSRPPECTPEEGRCVTFQTMDSCVDGRWQTVGCGVGETCRNSSNGPFCGLECIAGANRCTPGEVAKSDECLSGQGWVTSDCDPNYLCSQASGTCVFECTPGESTCVDNFTASLCDATDGWTDTACTGGQECRGGACVTIACSPGDSECATNGIDQLVCNSMGTDWDTSSCASGEYCSATSATETTCLTQVCTPGEVQCSAMGADREVCNANGSGWDVVETCAIDQICDDDGAGTTTCICNPTGTATIPALDVTLDTLWTEDTGSVTFTKACDSTTISIASQGAGTLESTGDCLQCNFWLWVEGYGEGETNQTVGCHTGAFTQPNTTNDVQGDIDCPVPAGTYTITWRTRNQGCGGTQAPTGQNCLMTSTAMDAGEAYP